MRYIFEPNNNNTSQNFKNSPQNFHNQSFQDSPQAQQFKNSSQSFQQQQPPPHGYKPSPQYKQVNYGTAPRYSEHNRDYDYAIKPAPQRYSASSRDHNNRDKRDFGDYSYISDQYEHHTPNTRKPPAYGLKNSKSQNFLDAFNKFSPVQENKRVRLYNKNPSASNSHRYNNQGTIKHAKSQPYLNGHSHNSQQQWNPGYSTENYTVPEKYNSIGRQRRSWSPPPKAMGSGSSFMAMRSYRSNDQLDAAEYGYDGHHDHLYEDLDSLKSSGPPPPIAPSGILSKSPDKGVIKPIAFKPVVPAVRYPTNSSSSPLRHDVKPPTPDTGYNVRYSSPAHKSHDVKSTSQDDGYGGSQDYSSANRSTSRSNLSNNSVMIDSDRNVSFENGHPASVPSRYLPRPESYNSSNHSRASNHMESYIHTPSPSDSGVAVTEFEAMLREKDQEIRNLRETMERNENAIIKTYEEKEQNHLVEVADVRDECEDKVKDEQQRCFKVEQSLLLQMYKLQQEKKDLQENCDKLRKENVEGKQHCDQLETELGEHRTKLDEAKWEMCQKTGEISLLKSQLKDSQDSSSSRSNEVLSLKSQLQDSEYEVMRRDQEIGKLRNDIAVKSDDLAKTRIELDKVWRDAHKDKIEEITQTDNEVTQYLHNTAGATTKSESPDAIRQKLRSQQEQFEIERTQWLEEKNKVVLYQKQLQLNYVQMLRKNRMLEAEIEQLTLELENRDLKLLAFNEQEESTC
ncbi:unnamed protein product [Owenia fusiformis]|uniref:Uncharacterized protein n=1 Tax=Owenia fusiformis TaxID=6347 RepID=A0A8S4NRZ1_OWEFU|nr:unnamed protein product [Owenia fusiformis]